MEIVKIGLLLILVFAIIFFTYKVFKSRENTENSGSIKLESKPETIKEETDRIQREALEEVEKIKNEVGY